jgi:hypothetical protein
MPRVIGGFAGLILGVFWYVLVASALGITSFGSVIAGIVSFFGLTIDEWIVVAAFSVAITTLFAYTVATIALIPTLAAPPVTGALPPNPVEGFMGGYISGFSAVVNFALWAFTPLGAAGFTIGFFVALLGFLSVFSGLSRNLAFQGILGWSNWIRPYSYLATAVGILLFLINLPFALATFGPAAIRLDPFTGTVETTGGIVGITGFLRGGFNLGNFTFISPPPGLGLGFRSAFGGPGISAHETGHTLTVASFGGVFHWINAIDENLLRTRATSFLAYGELIPESHFPGRPGPFRNIRIWS